MKNICSKTKEISERKRHYFYSFAKLSDVWFHKRWLAFLSASAFNLLWYRMSCSLWKTSLHTHEKPSVEKANNILVL